MVENPIDARELFLFVLRVTQYIFPFERAKSTTLHQDVLRLFDFLNHAAIYIAVPGLTLVQILDASKELTDYRADQNFIYELIFKEQRSQGFEKNCLALHGQQIFFHLALSDILHVGVLQLGSGLTEVADNLGIRFNI